MLHLAKIGLALALSLPAIAADAADCGRGAARIVARLEHNLGMAHVYIQEMELVHDGPGWAGDWIGTRYIHTNIYSWDITRPFVPPPMTHAVEGYELTCTSAVTDNHTLVTDCAGRLPFRVLADGTITWAANGRVVGKLTPGGSGPIAIDLVSWDTAASGTRMTGTYHTSLGEGPGIDIARLGATENAGPATFTIRATLPEGGNPFTEVSLTATQVGSAPDGPVIELYPPDEVHVTLEGGPDERLDLAEEVAIRLETRFGGCTDRRDMSLTELLLIYGLEP